MIRKLKYYYYLFVAEFWLGMVESGMREVEALKTKSNHVEALLLLADVNNWMKKFEIANQKAEELKRA